MACGGRLCSNVQAGPTERGRYVNHVQMWEYSVSIWRPMVIYFKPFTAPMSMVVYVPRDRVECLSRSISDAVDPERLFEIINIRLESRSLTIRSLVTRHPGSLLVQIRRTRYPVRNR